MPSEDEIRRNRALLDYMIQRLREHYQWLLDDPPLSEEDLQERRKLAEAILPDDPLPPPEELTEGPIDRAHLLKWLEDEATATDQRVGFAPSRPGTALRSVAQWIRVAYRPDP